jgi:hypothetical protein
VLKRDFAPEITASAKPFLACQAPLEGAAHCANPEKKGICATRAGKKRLRKRAHVLFFAPILNKRQHCAAFRNY